MRRLNPLALLVAAAFFMEFLDGTIITTALPRMADSLRTDPVELHVGITAYVITVAVFILPGGWMADRFGARPVFTGAIVVFTVGSALCGLADSTGTFVAARILQGLGGAMMVPVGRLVVLRTTAKPDLMRAIATLTWPGLSAPLLGPPLGGLIAEHLGWRYIFLVNIPLGIVAAALAWRITPRIAAVARRFDAAGFALAGGAVLCASVGIDAAGQSVGLAAALGAVALGSGALFARHASRRAEPLLTLAPWSVPTFRMVMLGGLAMRVLIAAMPFLLPLLFQLGFGWDPFRAGLMVLALFAGNIAIKPLTSPILRRWGFRAVMAVNGMLQAALMLACAALGPATPVPAIAALLLAAGASRSMQFTALGTLAFADVPEPAMSSANTWFSVGFQLGTGLGVVVGAVLLQAAGAAAGEGLAAFRWAFTVLAGLMAASALSGLWLERGAGRAVSGQVSR